MREHFLSQTTIIKEARLRKGYSQQQVATLIGVYIRQYQRLEKGERDIRMTCMKLGLAVCAVLDIDPFILTFGKEYEWPEK